VLIHDGFSWHPTTNRAFYEQKMRTYREDGYLDFHESDNLVAVVVKEKSFVLTNSPSADPRSKGVPAGHPPLRCFLGTPALKEQDVVGIIGLANRPNGYSASEQAMVDPLMPSVVSLYETYCRLQRDGRLKMSKATGQ